MKRVRGMARVDRRTKNLCSRALPGDVAIICHRDVDGPAAQALVARGVGAVVNADRSISGRYPNLGPQILLAHGIPILDNVGAAVLEEVREGDVVEVVGDALYLSGRLVAKGEPLTEELLSVRLSEARQNLSRELRSFVENTLSLVQAEQGLLFEPSRIPELKTMFQGRHALVVVRGEGCRDDLHAIASYVREMRPVLIAVDGGADVLLEFGFTPDLIIGDMDSVSDRALRSGAELVVHAYPDGRCPGLSRLESMGLQAAVFPSIGTSEDIALLLAYEKGADLITAVGTHTSLVDFLEKARGGMASTFLVRLRVGSALVDAKGVSRLYRQAISPIYLVYLLATMIAILGVILWTSPQVRAYLMQFWLLRLRPLF